ncbi:MAG TPA: RNA polymerase sigma factor [Povalibacter sp.]|nr:RNA polymerase sigma factor [Povalibacter sp.]
MALAQRRDLQLLEQLSDTELAARVCRGDTALFELIMRRYNRRLFRIARGILGNDAEAEDAVQEAYVCAWYKLGQFRGPDGFASWLCQIATNEALMRRRRRKDTLLTPLTELNEPSNEEAAMADPQSPHVNPEADLHERQLRQLLERAIDRLPDTYRDVFMLREVEQVSVADTAAFLGIEEGAVKTRVHRARRLLQLNLTGELSAALRGTFDFDGARCDRLVEGIFRRINGLQRP